MTKNLRYLIMIPLVIVSCFVGACTHSSNQHAYIEEEQHLQKAKEFIGKSESDLLTALGKPSFTSLYPPKTIIYTGYSMERHFFFKPTIVNQVVVAFEMNEHNHVEKVSIFDVSNRRNITINSDATHTIGQGTSLLDQLLGNIGRMDHGQNNDQ